MTTLDATLLGETAAQIMDRLDSHPDADEMVAIEAVQIVVVVACADGDDTHTLTMLQSSHESQWQQLGLSAAGRECLVSGDLDP